MAACAAYKKSLWKVDLQQAEVREQARAFRSRFARWNTLF